MIIKVQNIFTFHRLYYLDIIYFRATPTSNIYIGLSKSNESEGQYVWTDGTLATDIPWSVHFTDSPHNENMCVALDFNGGTFGSFIKYDCETTTSYLCTGMMHIKTYFRYTCAWNKMKYQNKKNCR